MHWVMTSFFSDHLIVPPILFMIATASNGSMLKLYSDSLNLSWILSLLSYRLLIFRLLSILYPRPGSGSYGLSSDLLLPLMFHGRSS